MARLFGLLPWLTLALSKQILYQPGASNTFVAHRELPFTVQYAGRLRPQQKRGVRGGLEAVSSEVGRGGEIEPAHMPARAGTIRWRRLIISYQPLQALLPAHLPALPSPLPSLSLPLSPSHTCHHHPSPRSPPFLADANAIEAITCVDYVQLGEYKARVPFACFLKASTPQLKDIDGVAGFGIPKLGAHGEALPMPLLWALTDPSNVEKNSQALERRFTFFSSEHSAELQLGGYDPRSLLMDDMHRMDSLSPVSPPPPLSHPPLLLADVRSPRAG